MNPLAIYALQGLGIGLAMLLPIWAACKFFAKPRLPGWAKGDPGPEWYVSSATRNHALLAKDREEL